MGKGTRVSGSRARGEHTTVIDAGEPLVKVLRGYSDIGIAPGLIEKKARRGSGRSIKCTLTDYGLLVQVTGGLYVQKLTVRCGTRERGREVFAAIKPDLTRAYNRVTLADG